MKLVTLAAALAAHAGNAAAVAGSHNADGGAISSPVSLLGLLIVAGLWFWLSRK